MKIMKKNVGVFWTDDPNVGLFFPTEEQKPKKVRKPKKPKPFKCRFSTEVFCEIGENQNGLIKFHAYNFGNDGAWRNLEHEDIQRLIKWLNRAYIYRVNLITYLEQKEKK